MIHLQERGIRSVLVVTREFEVLARALAKSHGCPDMPMVVVPHPFTTLPEDAVLELADQFQSEIVGELVGAVNTGSTTYDLLRSRGETE